MARAPAPPRPNPPPQDSTVALGRPQKGERLTHKEAQARAPAPPGSFVFDSRPVTAPVRDVWLENRGTSSVLTIIIEDQNDETSDFVVPFLFAGAQLPVRFSFVCHFKGGKLFQASAAGRACFSGQTSPVRQLKLSGPQLEGREQHV